MAMNAIGNEHSYSNVSIEYKISRSSLKDNMNVKTRSRKMDPKGVLKTKEETALCKYIEEMATYGLFLIPFQIKIKIGQMT